MTFKLDIGDSKSKKTYHLETASEAFIGKKLGDKIEGKDIPEIKEFADYEFTITGASDNAGFPALNMLEGVGRRKVLLKQGKGMKDKKPRGLRKIKTIRGNTISENIVQINLKVSKQGKKSFSDIFKKEENNEKMEEENKIKEENNKEVVEENKEESVEEEKTDEVNEDKEESVEEVVEENKETDETKEKV